MRPVSLEHNICLQRVQTSVLAPHVSTENLGVYICSARVYRRSLYLHRTCVLSRVYARGYTRSLYLQRTYHVSTVGVCICSARWRPSRTGAWRCSSPAPPRTAAPRPARGCSAGMPSTAPRQLRGRGTRARGRGSRGGGGGGGARGSSRHCGDTAPRPARGTPAET